MTTEEKKPAVRLELNALKAVNYALQAGGISVVRSVSIFNDTDATLEHVDLTLRTDPAFCLPFALHFDSIAPNSVCRTGPLELTVDGAYLSGLTEKTAGLLHVAVEQNGTVLSSESRELTALAFDEWHGYGYYPELLASFVTPNHPALTPLIARAAELLDSWTGDPSLDAYQTQDPNRVLKQAAAAYGALQEQNIVYAVPPASYEVTGQRVRLCDTVLQQKMGTCLDLTLVYCGMLEAMGLHPLLIIQPGHIFAGVWLDALTFPEAVQDDAALITKRLAGGISEIAVVESTAFTAGKDMAFDRARAAAEAHLTGKEGLEYIIDVRRCRLSGVTPLPQRVLTDQGWEVLRPTLSAAELTAAPQESATPLDVAEADSEELTKKVQWERKLLDLGLRNNLINMRLRKNMVPILTASIDELENALSSGSDFTIHPRPSDYHTEDGVTFESVSNLQGHQELIRSEFQNKRLRSAFTEGELTKSLKDLYRTAKTALEENGANTLYLAMGLLRWYETPKSTKARYAPLVMLPIEIVRKSARVGYVIRIRDEEAQMNVTLLEKLKQDHRITVSGLDPLPCDESGTDLRRVFTVIRKAVMNQPRWDVLESAYLGIFSFSQFVMWNDIRNRSEDLERNKIVRSLMDGKLCWEAQDMTIGDKVPENGVFLPMAADASQLFAIEKAGEGESFVLHGPPGTGKSQTITTLIANALAQNKTVLFVAEKMAALEVVQRRLTKIGLGPFCLELHSNKSKKRDLLEQLRMATEVTKTTTAEEYAAKAEEIAAARAALNGYADALHAKQPSGQTLFDLVNTYEENRYAPDIAPFGSDFAAKTTGRDLNLQENAVERLVAAGRSVEHPCDHPLSSIGCTEYTQQLRYAIPPVADAYRQAILALRDALATFRTARSLPELTDHTAIAADAALARELQFWLPLPDAWSHAENPPFYFTETERMARHYHNAAGIRGELLKIWTPEFLSQDGKAMAKEWDEATGKWFLPRLLGQNGLIRRLNTFAKGSVDKNAVRQQLTVLCAYQEERSAADALFETYGPGLGSLYQADATDWQMVGDTAANARRSAETLGCVSRSADGAAVNGLCAAWTAFEAARDALSAIVSLSDDTAGADYLAKQENICTAIADHIHELKDWIAWNHAAAEAAALGLENVLESYRCGAGHDDILPAYRKAASQALAMAAIDGDRNLRSFSGAVFNETIRQFKRMDQELMDLTQREIYCRLASRVPNFTKEAAHSSELGILQRAIRSGGRGVSIRKLFEQIPNLLPRLCPCMLMSPISAAQYLDPKREPFHMVVFDEASQLPTCKAVGALARGENAVVVGDPKQMPPTAFFATNTLDEENLDMEDLESILDDCLALNIPQTHLLWHYRSRHESLIAFSNSRFYENKLYTFPSVNDRDRKVRLVHVDGVFERGKNRQNRAEAQAIVEELKRRCHDESRSKQSVGIVTFNINQQHLIDDMLSEACREDTALETWAYQSPEPLFIKNLENVQGDERDVILFSIGYGPDEQGKVYMNFGPLNRDGGWRRLNVAITRARQEMTVFATLKPEQIDLGRTTAEGVSALKAFLEYADRGILPQTGASGAVHTAQGIPEAICAWLKQQGYETDYRVGHSEYRIDIGVIDPEAPDRYVLGILLDGDSYGAAKTTRDREIAQIGVLEGLGWRIHRVWTMDWWDNSQAELAKILEVLQTPPVPPEDTAPEVTASAPKLASGIPAAPAQKPVFPVYTPAKLRQSEVTAEDFLLPRYNAGIRKKIEAVINAEAPVSKNLLVRRVVQSYSITRAGSRINRHMDGILDDMSLLTTSLEDQVFFWRPDQDPAAYAEFRVADTEENRREPKDIPVQEAANAVRQALADQISMTEEDLIREGAKLLGFSRLSSAVTALMTAAIAYAAAYGTITTGPNGNYVLSDPQ